MILNVLSFNLRTWTDADGKNAWPYRKDMVAELIQRLRPDIVGVQEALTQMLTDIDQRLSGYEYVGEGRLGGNDGEFSAIYYRKTLGNPVETDQFWLSETPKVPGSKSWNTSHPRVCTWALFNH